jgi:tungstate transport system substrate-binding protein
MSSSKNHGTWSTRKLSLIGLSLVSILMVFMLLAGCSTSTPTPTPTSAPTTTPVPATTTAPPATTSAPTSTTAAPTTAASPKPTASASPSPSTPPRTSYSAKEIILSSTTSVRDSGLMDQLLPVFQTKSGFTVKPIYNGSGAALALGAKGEADVLVVHSPTAEKTFMTDGNGSDRRLIMHNDFVVLGPASDPAKVKGSATVVDAFKAIVAAAPNNKQVTFYSRGDNSGTDATEKGIFKSAGVTVVDKSPNNPSWYIESGSGMGQLLLIASDKQGYTLSDRATYLAYKDKIALGILFEGDPALLNLYHVIQVNPAKFPGIINADGAKAFADFIVGKDAQDIIGKYTDKSTGVLLFVPDGGKTDADLGVK